MIKIRVKSVRESKSLKEWFSEKDFRAMDSSEQEQYLKDHPNSKFKPDDRSKDTKDNKSKEVPSKDKEQPKNDKEVQKKEPEKYFSKEDIKAQKVLNKLKEKFSDKEEFIKELENQIYKDVRKVNSGKIEKFSDPSIIYSRLINELPENERLDLLTYGNTNLIQFIKNPTEEEVSYVAWRNPLSLRHVNPDKITKEDRDTALSRDGRVIEYLKNPTEEERIKAVQTTPSSINFIDNPSEKVQVEALKRDGAAIQYIKNPSDKMKLFAINSGCKDYRRTVIDYINNPTEEMKLLQVQKKPDRVDHIDNPSDKVLMTAINRAEKLNLGIVFKQIIEKLEKEGRKPSEEVQIAAANRWNPSSFSDGDPFVYLTDDELKGISDKAKKVRQDRIDRYNNGEILN